MFFSLDLLIYLGIIIHGNFFHLLISLGTQSSFVYIELNRNLKKIILFWFFISVLLALLFLAFLWSWSWKLGTFLCWIHWTSNGTKAHQFGILKFIHKIFASSSFHTFDSSILCKINTIRLQWSLKDFEINPSPWMIPDTNILQDYDYVFLTHDGLHHLILYCGILL